MSKKVGWAVPFTGKVLTKSERMAAGERSRQAARPIQWTRDTDDGGNAAWWLSRLDGHECAISTIDGNNRYRMGGIPINAPVGVVKDHGGFYLVYDGGGSDGIVYGELELAKDACILENRAAYEEAK